MTNVCLCKEDTGKMLDAKELGWNTCARKVSGILSLCAAYLNIIYSRPVGYSLEAVNKLNKNVLTRERRGGYWTEWLHVKKLIPFSGWLGLKGNLSLRYFCVTSQEAWVFNCTYSQLKFIKPVYSYKVNVKDEKGGEIVGEVEFYVHWTLIKF